MEPISDSDSDFEPERKNKKVPNRDSNRKHSALKLSSTNSKKQKQTKKVQSTLAFPIIKRSNNKFNKCGPSRCTDCGMLYYPGRDEDDSLHSKFHQNIDEWI